MPGAPTTGVNPPLLLDGDGVPETVVPVPPWDEVGDELSDPEGVVKGVVVSIPVGSTVVPVPVGGVVSVSLRDPVVVPSGGPGLFPPGPPPVPGLHVQMHCPYCVYPVG